MKTFDHFLSTVDVLSSPRLALLSPSKLAAEVHRSALARITTAYAKVHDRVMDPKERYEFRTTAMRLSVAEIETLLGSE